MKKLILTFTLHLIFIVLYAQNYTISGVIVNENDEPLVGASVSIENSYTGAYTNTKGEYTLEKIKSGNVGVQVSYVGYESLFFYIDLQSDTTLILGLDPAQIMLQTVMLTAVRAKELTPVAQTTIGAAELEENTKGKDIPYLLELTPAMVATSETGTGIGYTGMRIRGTDMTRTNFTVNGIPLNDAESQTVFWVNMADFGSSVESVQIQRGVGTSSNGAASFGASVNFETQQVQEKPHATVSTTFGSFGTRNQSVSAGTGLLGDSFYAAIRLSNSSSDGWVYRSFTKNQSAHATASYMRKNQKLTANIMLGKEKTGISWEGNPDYMIDIDPRYNPAGKYYDELGNEQFYANETDNYWQNHYSLAYELQMGANWSASVTAHGTTGNGFYEQYKSNAKFSKYGLQAVRLTDTVVMVGERAFVFADSIVKQSDIIRQKSLDNTFWGLTGTAVYKKNNVELHIGTAANWYNGSHFGDVISIQAVPDFNSPYEWYRNKSDKNSSMAFAKLYYNLSPKITLFLDGQFRHITYTMQGVDDDLELLNNNFEWDFFNPKAGVYYTINKRHSLFGSFAVAHREPTRTDLKEAGKSMKQVSYETLYDTELGYTYRVHTHALSVNLYNMHYDNQLVLTGKLNNVGAARMENVPESYRRGAEFMLNTRFVPTVAWNSAVSLSRNIIKNYTEYSINYDDNWNEEIHAKHIGRSHISYSPQIVANTQLVLHPTDDIQLGLTYKYVGAQYYDNSSNADRSIPSYSVVNFSSAYSIAFQRCVLKIQANVYNLLNNSYISNAYGGNWYEQGDEKNWSYFFPQAPMHVVLKTSLTF